MSPLVPAECPVCAGGCAVHCVSSTCSWWKCVGVGGAKACGSFGDVRAGKAHLTEAR